MGCVRRWGHLLYFNWPCSLRPVTRGQGHHSRKGEIAAPRNRKGHIFASHRRVTLPTPLGHPHSKVSSSPFGLSPVGDRAQRAAGGNVALEKGVTCALLGNASVPRKSPLVLRQPSLSPWAAEGGHSAPRAPPGLHPPPVSALLLQPSVPHPLASLKLLPKLRRDPS